MTQNRRSWIFVIIFWLLFLVSIGLNERHSWVHTAWVYAALLFAIVGSVFSVSEMSRHSDGSGQYVYYRGAPRWMRWFVLDDEEYAKDKERQRIADEKKT
jgi:hypothetical protein